MRAPVSTRHVEVDAVVHRSVLGRVVAGDAAAGGLVRPAARRHTTSTEVTQRIFTLIVEPVDDDKALAELRSAAARHGGEQEAAREGRTRWDPFKARKASAVTAREQEVAAGADRRRLRRPRRGHRRRRRQRWSGRRKAMQRRFRRRRVLLRPLWGRMELGVAAALPLGLGLSREPF